MILIIINERWPNGETKRIKWNDGEEHFYNKEGSLHRENGPAVIFPFESSDKPEYFLNGIKLDILNDEELIIKLMLE